MRRVVALVLAGSTLCACARRDRANLARAQADLDQIAGAIGTRPVGSPADARARDYLTGQLRDAGLSVRLQDANAVDESRHLTVPVVNIIATKQGSDPDAIALVAHVDSVPEGPGAADDGLGVVSVLESARVLAAEPRRYSLFVILTDGEEMGMMGARAAVEDPEIRSRVKAFVNFDGTGAAGIADLFEAGPGLSSALEAWARAAPQPQGASFATEIYKRLPNDTDFTIFKQLGASGLNFGPVDDSYAYHTDRDRPERLQSSAIRQEISNTVAIVRALDARGGADRRDVSPTYFTVLASHAFVYGPSTARLLGVLGLLFGVGGWGRLTARLWRSTGPRRLVAAAAAAVVAAVVFVSAMLGVAALLGAVRPERVPWYAAPDYFFLSMAASGAFGWWTVRQLASRLRPGIRPPSGSSMAVWWIALPVWTTLAVALDRLAPGAAFLGAIPLCVAGLGALLTRSESGLRVASVVVAITTTVLWGVIAFRLLHFMVPLSGWLPSGLPPIAYAFVLAAVAVMVAIPVLAVLSWSARQSPTRWAGALLAVVAIGAFGAAWTASAYTASRPERRLMAYTRDLRNDRAWLQVAGSEPLSPSELNGGPQVSWQPELLSPGVAPVVVRSDIAPLEDPVPATLSAMAGETSAGAWTIDLSIHATESTLVSVLGQSHLVAGNSDDVVHLQVLGDTPPLDLLVTLTTASIHDGRLASRLPPWVVTDHTAWRAISTFLTAVSVERVTR